MHLHKKRRNRRLTFIVIVGAVLALTVGLVMSALSEQIVFFKSPTDIAQQNLDVGVRMRVGGLVKEGSVTREGETVSFTVTDTAHDLDTTYTGILPDLFREGQGIVIEGALNESGLFVTDTVMAKHDETYMPKEVAEALKENGTWEGEAGASLVPPTN